MSTGKLTVTSQKWVNELAGNKSGKRNIISDTLGCASEQKDLEFLQSCT